MFGSVRNRSTCTYEMALTTYRSTWRNIPEDLYFLHKVRWNFKYCIFQQTSSSQNNYSQPALNNVNTVTLLALPTHNYPYFAFHLSTGPKASARPVQQYRRHNKINKSIFPLFFDLTMCTHACTHTRTCTHIHTRAYKTHINTHTHTEFKILSLKLWSFCSTDRRSLDAQGA
jgi:hypothetical protein